jgi:hypothetical protein
LLWLERWRRGVAGKTPVAPRRRTSSAWIAGTVKIGVIIKVDENNHLDRAAEDNVG